MVLPLVFREACSPTDREMRAVADTALRASPDSRGSTTTPNEVHRLKGE
jgi:hypothetical protein